jgi:deoxyribodipyrimidine photo-lyase
MAAHPAIVWFRNDLRLDDHPALRAAAGRGGPVVPLFVWSPDEHGDWPPGAASQWWLHHSLDALARTLRRRKLRLILRRGDTLKTLRDVAKATGADAAFWNRRYEPATTQRDAEIKLALRRDGLTAESFNGALLFEPWDVLRDDRPYQVFTPFWKACLPHDAPREPSDAPSRLSAPKRWPRSLDLDALGLRPEIDWAAGFGERWTPGETGAHAALHRFIDDALRDYDDARNRPDRPGTSRLSPHLHFGEISPRRVWHTIRDVAAHSRRKPLKTAADAYLRELGWREFAHHLLYHFPHTTDEPLRESFAAFGWRRDRKALRAWQRGRTGYPIVDAGMRELWHTGWMHNRVRMIVASFLVKDLLIAWQEGAHWFWDTLVDADLANNTLGWQWSAGCGADAAPYFRIFNPVSQGETFDPDGAYVRRWVPELSDLPTRWIHKPWEADEGALSAANVTLGETYPEPIVDHAAARRRALDAFNAIRTTASR